MALGANQYTRLAYPFLPPPFPFAVTLVLHPFYLRHEQHPGPGGSAQDPAAINAVELNSSDGAAEGATASAAAAAKTEASGRRQNRRRWRLLQYLLGWVEMVFLEGGSGGRASVEAEEALAAASAAFIAVSCPGPPAAEDGSTAAALGGGDAGSGAAGGGHGVAPAGSRRFRRRPFLVETGEPPCPAVGAAAGIFVEGCAAAGGVGAIADGVWGGVLDNLGPFLRHGGERARSGRGAGATAGRTADAVWGCFGGVGAGGGRGSDVDLPAYVDFMASTLRECGEKCNGCEPSCRCPSRQGGGEEETVSLVRLAAWCEDAQQAFWGE